MNELFLVLLALLFLQEKSTTSPWTAPENAVLTDKIVAIVNNEVITLSELNKRLESAKKTFGFQDPETWKEFEREELQRMAHEKLIAQAARRAALNQELVERLVKEQLTKEEEAAGGKETLIENLKQVGKTYDEYSNELRNQIMIEYLREYEMGRAPGASGRAITEIYIPPGEMKRYYEMHPEEFTQREAVHGKQIFLSYEKFLKPEDAKAKALEIITALEENASFEELAKQYSDWRPELAGDLGWIESGYTHFDKTIERYLFENPAGSISEPLHLQRGIAIVKIEEKREQKKLSFMEIQQPLYDKLLREKRQERLEALQLKLQQESYWWPPDLFFR